jgi:hypothetical protein
LVKVAKSTMVLAGRTVRLELPLAVSNCTDTKSTRYARKLSVDAVLVIVTTAVPLQAARASNAAARGTRKTLCQLRRTVDRRLEHAAIMDESSLLGRVLFSDSCCN